MKTYLVPVIASVVVLVVYFSILPTYVQENSLSKQCDIPFDENFIESRRVTTGPNDGKPHYSIEEEFSIFYTIPVGEFRVDDTNHSLILKPVPTSHGYVIMCDPLPILEKRFEKKLHGLFILVDGEEVEPNLINSVLRIDINNNTGIEITDSSSKLKLKDYASVLSEINRHGIIYQNNGDSEQFTQQMNLMQQKQKEMASKILGLNINEAYVAEGWNFPFRESSKITMHIPEFKRPLCDIPEKIPVHLQMISQSEMFQMFAGKYSQHDLTLDISDERNHRGWIHYNLGAITDDARYFGKAYGEQ